MIIANVYASFIYYNLVIWEMVVSTFHDTLYKFLM